MGPKIGKPLLITRVESLSLRKKADASRRQTSNKTVSLFVRNSMTRRTRGEVQGNFLAH